MPLDDLTLAQKVALAKAGYSPTGVSTRDRGPAPDLDGPAVDTDQRDIMDKVPARTAGSAADRAFEERHPLPTMPAKAPEAQVDLPAPVALDPDAPDQSPPAADRPEDAADGAGPGVTEPAGPAPEPAPAPAPQATPVAAGPSPAQDAARAAQDAKDAADERAKARADVDASNTELKNAQRWANINRATAHTGGLMDSAAMMMAQHPGLVDPSYARGEEAADEPVKQLLARRDEAQKQAQQAKIQALDDPNSAVSRQATMLAQAQGLIKPGVKIAASQWKDMQEAAKYGLDVTKAQNEHADKSLTLAQQAALEDRKLKQEVSEGALTRENHTTNAKIVAGGEDYRQDKALAQGMTLEEMREANALRLAKEKAAAKAAKQAALDAKTRATWTKLETGLESNEKLQDEYHNDLIKYGADSNDATLGAIAAAGSPDGKESPALTKAAREHLPGKLGPVDRLTGGGDAFFQGNYEAAMRRLKNEIDTAEASGSASPQLIAQAREHLASYEGRHNQLIKNGYSRAALAPAQPAAPASQAAPQVPGQLPTAKGADGGTYVFDTASKQWHRVIN